jgi:DNA-binding beta-propeller fold protein YncE
MSCSRVARMAVAVAVVLLCAASVAQAADPPGYVYATGSDLAVRGFSAGTDGLLAPLGDPFAAGRGSASIAATPDGGTLYVVNQIDRTVSEYDVADNGGLSRKGEPVATGNSPYGIAVAPDGRHAYVADGDDDQVSIYAVDASGALAPAGTAATGDFPLEIALSADGSSAYVTNFGSGTVSQFDVGTDGGLTPKAPAQVAAGSLPFGVAVARDGHAVYVANDVTPGTVSQLAVGADGALTPMVPDTVAAGGAPVDVVAGANGVYVANSNDNSISQYDAGVEGALTPKADPAPTAAAPFGLALSQDGQSLYATAFTDNAIAQFDVGAGGVLAPKASATVAAGTGPIGIAFVVPPDRSAPTVDVRTPEEGAYYALDTAVAADYSCADTGGSSLVSCTGDVAVGAPIDLSTPGEHTFTVVARDGAGHETSLTHHYSVGSSFQGFAVDPGRIADARAGRTLAIGFSLGGFRGLDVLAPGSPGSVEVDCSDPGEATGGEPAAGDTGLRYIRSSGTYRFDWLTDRAWAGTCRDFVLTLSDGSVQRLLVHFRDESRPSP